MKIAFVTSKTEATGGVQVFTDNLTRSLRNRGHTVSIIGEESLPIGRRTDLTPADVEVAVGEFFNDLNAEENFDAVLCNGEMGYAVNHPHAINIFHGSYYGYATSVQHLVPAELTAQRLVKTELQRVSAQGKLVVAVSDFAVKDLKESGIKVDKVIRNTVDTQIFYPSDSKIGTNVLAISRGRKFEKGFDILEELAQRGVNIRLFSDRRIDSPHVENIGFRDNRELPQEYRQAQLFLNPTRYEGGGLTTLEAMASGCPVLTTPTGYGLEIAKAIPNFVVSDVENIGEYLAKHSLISSRRREYSKQALEYFLEVHNPEIIEAEWIKTVEN
ncbi:hypothetical protein COU60_05575 [Candidatus Pacearchaeota archaeon CG10_big_fil_rev_8_21_14_0_10_34_76]|nr:MAG: hypothetical protein COU60_05575 [Candidatus Pacearchaeota archaeon CG10_big_fil_rev_8_21_14_0_10_34_76]